MLRVPFVCYWDDNKFNTLEEAIQEFLDGEASVDYEEALNINILWVGSFPVVAYKPHSEDLAQYPTRIHNFLRYLGKDRSFEIQLKNGVYFLLFTDYEKACFLASCLVGISYFISVNEILADIEQGR